MNSLVLNKKFINEFNYFYSVKDLVTFRPQVGSPIGLVVATDADLGDNAAVTYRFSKTISPEMDALFYIDSNSGEIMVKKDLQYESGRNFETIVEARDRGNPPKV